MPKARPISQQRKRRVRVSKSAAFPVPIETVTGESASGSNWFYYTACLEDTGVLVKHSGDMDFLYKMGFFGKGSMSRGQPQWSEHWRVVTLPRQQACSSGQQSMLRAKVTSRRRYMTHLKWHLLSEGDSAGLDMLQNDQHHVKVKELRDSSTKPDVKNLHHPSISNQDFSQSEAVANETEMSLNAEECAEHTAADVHMKSPQRQPDWGEEEGDEDFWGAEDISVSKKDAEVPAMSWESSAAGDADFWGTKTASGSDTNKSDDIDKPECFNLSSVSDKVKEGEHPRHKGSLGKAERNHSLTDSTEVIKMSAAEHSVFSQSTVNNLLSEQLTVKDKATLCDRNQQTLGKLTASDGVCDRKTTTESKAVEASVVTSNAENTPGLHNENTPSRQPASEIDHATEETYTNCSNRTVKKSDSAFSCDDNEITHNPQNENAPGSASSGEVEWSKFCESSNDIAVASGNSLFVTPDSDEERPQGDGKVCRMKTRWRPVVKRDPFPVKENLHLGYEETYFLSYGLGCLTVLDSQQTAMDLGYMWREFCQRQPSFLPNYIAYHHYRSKNWVPKTGLKFGCTFLLYKDGPPFYHGSHSVVVKFVDTEGKPVEGFGEQRQFSWTSLAGLKRITEHVGKELMFCYVIKPKDMTAEDMMSPKCVTHFQIKEMVVSRWVSSQEREGKALEEIP